MDIFKFNNPTNDMKMESGELINGLTSKTWIERYRDPGEFKLIAPARTNIRNTLPIGSFISHVNTKEIMIVENHEISGKKGDDIEITVTGSSFETILHQRIVGSNRKLTSVQPYQDYVLDKDLTWRQLVNLIRFYIDINFLVDPNDELPYVSVDQVVDAAIPSDYLGEVIERVLERGSVYEHVLNLLSIDNLGIKTIRPPDEANGPNTTLQIHRGIDRSKEIIFSYALGQFENLDYLFSNKPLKNAALVSTTWCEMMVYADESAKRDRRVMNVEATDIDQDHDSMPEGFALDLVSIAMDQRGRKALKAQSEVALRRADLVQDSTVYKYRTDYDLGDVVGISGAYLTGQTDSTTLRVIEHIESEDENGSVAYPTLAIDPPVE